MENTSSQTLSAGFVEFERQASGSINFATKFPTKFADRADGNLFDYRPGGNAHVDRPIAGRATDLGPRCPIWPTASNAGSLSPNGGEDWGEGDVCCRRGSLLS